MSGPFDVNSVAARLSPGLFEAEFAARRSAWLDPLEAQGWHAQIFAHQGVLDGSLGNHVQLPPYLGVGHLRLEPEHLARWSNRVASQWVASYLSQHAYPALVSWSRATVVSFRAMRPADSETVLLLAQRTLVSVIASLRPDLVRVMAIDTVGFGRRAALLRAAVPRLTLITALEEVHPAVLRLQATLRENIDALGLRDTNLGDFNRRNQDAARAFTFVFLSSDALQRESFDVVRRMANEDIGVRGGVQFVVVATGESTEAESALLTPNSPRVLAAGSVGSNERTRLEVVDVSGLDTRDGGAHAAFEVVTALDVDVLERIAQSCRRHLEAGRAPTVTLPLAPADARWRADASEGISVMLGRAGSQVVQLTLGGGGLTYNALIGGAVGTGKTVLLHGIVSQVATSYSPDDVQLSLLDYKEGTEFALYRELPHIYALSLGPSPEFGFQVLRSLQHEMSRRASLYKETGVQDLAAYRRVTGTRLPRHLVVIDEFQVLLADRADARDVLEDLIRRGRSAGIHIVLASQSLGDMSLNTAVLGQLGARICLKMSTSECARFLAPGNEAPANFQHAGQALLNEREGALDANVQFRAAYYDVGQLRAVVGELARRRPAPRTIQLPPYVYDADTPVAATMGERSALAGPDAVVWGLSQELPPRPLVSSLREQSTVAIVGHGGKVERLLGALREAAALAGLGVSESTSQDLVAAAASSQPAATGPVVVTLTSGGFATENALQSLRDQCNGLLVVVAREARALALSWLRDDVVCCDEASVNEIAFKRLPALGHEALAARARAGAEPAVFRLFGASRP